VEKPAENQFEQSKTPIAPVEVKRENVSPPNKSSPAEEQILNKPKEKEEVSMSKISEKIDNLKLTDSEPVQKKAPASEPVQLNKKQDDQHSDKSVNRGEKHVTESKDNQITNFVPTFVKDIKVGKPTPVVVEQPKPTPPEPQQQKPIIQQSAQQPSAVKSQQPSNQQPNVSQVVKQNAPLQKKSSLDGCQSKSDSKNFIYDHEFLKSLQFNSLSTKKPDFQGLNGKGINEILLPEARPKQAQHSNMLFDFDPNFGNRMGQRMNSDNKMPRKIISSNSLTQDVKLRTTENAWRPEFKRTDDETTESLIKRARGMLNKLTPQNFEKIRNDFMNFKIDQVVKLKKLIELIFDKAVDEPAFCDQYAQLCKEMGTITVQEGEGPVVKFNTLLLERCQTCFEDDKYKDINLEERLQEIEECTDKEKKQQLIDELDEEKRQVRKKSLGNIKLIGALYKNGRLKDEIMDLCIETLIKNGDEDSLECLCSLLKSIGQKFEGKTQHKNRFNEQMKRLERLVSQNKVVSRIKFLIMDVLDMRKDNWTLRKLQNVNKPKTIEEVHEDAKKKEEESNREISQLKNRPDSLKKRTDNSWMNSNSRKSQQSNSDALTNLRKLNE